jgi:hypothetical protein
MWMQGPLCTTYYNEEYMQTLLYMRTVLSAALKLLHRHLCGAHSNLLPTAACPNPAANPVNTTQSFILA